MLMTVKHKVIDIYGKLPKEVDLLFKKRYIDILSKEAFVKSLTERQTNVELVLEEEKLLNELDLDALETYIKNSAI